MGQAFSRELRQFEVTLIEWRVCVALLHKSHQRLSDLAANTATDPSTLSRTVEALMRRELLLRDRSERDGRALALSLTEAGRALAERIIPLAQLYERVAFAGISQSQAKLLRDTLNRVYGNMATLEHRD